MFSIGAVCMWWSILCWRMDLLPIGDGLRSLRDYLAGRPYCLTNAVAGGHTSVETGIYSGIGTKERKSCSSISSRLILLDVSTMRHCLMKSLAY